MHTDFQLGAPFVRIREFSPDTKERGMHPEIYAGGEKCKKTPTGYGKDTQNMEKEWEINLRARIPSSSRI